MRFDRKYLNWGLTAFLVICGVLVFYDTIFRNSVLFEYLNKLIGILSPVCYGFAMAYLLTPVVNWFERKLFPKGGRGSWPRSISIAITWVLVAVGFYVLMSILLPQLYTSILTLVANAEKYYNTIVTWIQKFLEDNPTAKIWLTSVVQDYYEDLLGWVTNKVLPQAQTAITVFTSGLVGGVVGVVQFLLDLLVGVIVSVYLLATKEHFAATGCKLAYSLFSQKRAEQIIRGTKAVNRIFSGFFRGKLLDSLIIGILCFIFSSIFQFPYAPLVSVVVGVTNVIPFFGPFLGAIPCAFIILLDSPIKCFYFVIFILVLQQFDGNILGPKILGDSTGLSSFWVIVAILVGGGMWGVIGMFVGVPLFACIYTGIRKFSAWRLEQKGLPIHSYNYRTHRPVTDEELGREPEGQAPDGTSGKGRGAPPDGGAPAGREEESEKARDQEKGPDRGTTSSGEDGPR